MIAARPFLGSLRLGLLLLPAVFATAGAFESPSDPGIDEAGMNQAAVAGDDFWQYCNGAWLAATGIPPDRGSWGAGSALEEETNQRK